VEELLATEAAGVTGAGVGGVLVGAAGWAAAAGVEFSAPVTATAGDLDVDDPDRAPRFAGFSPFAEVAAGGFPLGALLTAGVSRETILAAVGRVTGLTTTASPSLLLAALVGAALLMGDSFEAAAPWSFLTPLLGAGVESWTHFSEHWIGSNRFFREIPIINKLGEHITMWKSIHEKLYRVLLLPFGYNFQGQLQIHLAN